MSQGHEQNKELNRKFDAQSARRQREKDLEMPPILKDTNIRKTTQSFSSSSQLHPKSSWKQPASMSTDLANHYEVPFERQQTRSQVSHKEWRTTDDSLLQRQSVLSDTATPKTDYQPSYLATRPAKNNLGDSNETLDSESINKYYIKSERSSYSPPQLQHGEQNLESSNDTMNTHRKSSASSKDSIDPSAIPELVQRLSKSYEDFLLFDLQEE